MECNFARVFLQTDGCFLKLLLQVGKERDFSNKKRDFEESVSNL